MHKHITAISLCLSLSLAVASAIGISTGDVALAAAARYQSSTATFVSAEKGKDGSGTLTVSRHDEDRGDIVTKVILTPRTQFLRKHGGNMDIRDFHPGDLLSIYALRNGNGSTTALKVINQQSWFLDDAVSDGEIQTIDYHEKNMVLLEKDREILVDYNRSTLFLAADGKPATEGMVVPGTRVKIRGFMRKEENGSLSIEKSLIVWLLPAPGTTP